jgi:regulator of protease activity HflC (stomatin/prohibitin superfamily)
MLASVTLMPVPEFGFGTIALVIAFVCVASVILRAIKVVKEYERGVIFRLGRVRRGGAKGPATSCAPSSRPAPQR